MAVILSTLAGCAIGAIVGVCLAAMIIGFMELWDWWF